jgi:hypothetical protein
MTTKARPVVVTEHGVVTAAPGQRLRVVVAYRAEEMLAEAAPATRRLRMFRLG